MSSKLTQFGTRFDSREDRTGAKDIDTTETFFWDWDAKEVVVKTVVVSTDARKMGRPPRRTEHDDRRLRAEELDADLRSKLDAVIKRGA